MKILIILAISSSQICFAAAGDITVSSSQAESIHTTLLLEKLLNGKKSGVEDFNSSIVSYPGNPSTLQKVGSEASVSCTQTVTYENKLRTTCKIVAVQK